MSQHSVKFTLIAFAGLVGTALAGGVQPAHAQSTSYIVQQAVNSAVQSVLQNVRDQIQSGQVAPLPGGGTRLQFTAEDAATDNYYDHVFGALGYSGSPMLTKAPPMPAPMPPQWGVWGTGSGNFQSATIGGTTTTTSAGTGIGGMDYTKFGVTTTSDALVIGVNGSGTGLHGSIAGPGFASTENATTPAIGAYMAYINGGFSTDFQFLGAFTHLDTSTTAIGIPTATTMNSDSYSYTGDLNYRFNLENKWWIEPTVGATYGNTYTPGLTTGEIVTVQGGARVGNEITYENGVKLQTTLFGLAYSNVVETGNNVSGTTAAVMGDQGQVWGKGDLKFNFVFSPHFSAYVEGAIYGTSGTFTALGESVSGGLRYVF
jgi:hypothetical protein